MNLQTCRFEKRIIIHEGGGNYKRFFASISALHWIKRRDISMRPFAADKCSGVCLLKKEKELNSAIHRMPLQATTMIMQKLKNKKGIKIFNNNIIIITGRQKIPAAVFRLNISFALDQKLGNFKVAKGSR
jgi:hypothetical protein